MKNLLQTPWAKVALVVFVLAVLYAGYASSRGGPFLKSSKQTNVSQVDFPGAFAGFSGTGMGDGGKVAPMVSDSIVAERGIMPPIYGGSSGDTTGVDPKVIQNAYVTLEVDKVEEGVGKVKAIADSHQGLIVNLDFHETKTGSKSATITLKVPFSEFSRVLDEVKKVATFVGQETINSTDVTEEYTDLVSQLKNLKAEEEQYLLIMKRAEKIEDILNVASRLADVRGRIERTQGRINYLDARTDFSTITVQMSEELVVEAPTDKWRPLAELKRNARLLIVRLQDFVNNVIAFAFWLVGLIPYLIVFALVAWIARRIYRRSQKGRQGTTAP